MRPPDPEHRRCPVTGRWTVVAPERGARPITLADASPHTRSFADREFCPFCPGSEWDTPGEVYALRDCPDPDGPGWKLRVVPNRFPAVRPDAPAGFGHHEVLIDTPRHESDPGGLSVAETAAGLVAAADRVRVLGGLPGVAAVTFFRNVGAEAGASLAHTHAQLVATPFVPELLRRELDGVAGQSRCPFCALAGGERVVAETPGFVAVCPWAGRFDHEVWLLPKAHAARFESLTATAATEFAGLLRRVRRAVDAALGRPAYNEVVHTAPAGGGDAFHWHLELFPRTARAAGFEWGAGNFILTVAPERSAGLLRAHLPAEESP